jgi:NDP-sugar pyrophosphorylase family protein
VNELVMNDAPAPATAAAARTGARLVPRPVAAGREEPAHRAEAEVRIGPTHAVVMAGGRGLRLLPHTAATPKPLVTIGRYPIVEIILRQLRRCGVTSVTMCVGHLAGMIEDVLGDGGHLGLDVEYYADPEPLGTAGPLSALPPWREPAVVLNADILTALDFGQLYATHRAHDAALTVAAHVTHAPISHGVLGIADGAVHALWEKPTLQLEVCAGIYVLSARARSIIPDRGHFDMTDLIQALIELGEPVVAHRFHEDWHDMGTPESLERARRAFADNEPRYLS